MSGAQLTSRELSLAYLDCVIKHKLATAITNEDDLEPLKQELGEYAREIQRRGHKISIADFDEWSRERRESIAEAYSKIKRLRL